MEITAFVCSHVFENTRPVLLVCRARGDWQCLCGGEHNRDERPLAVGLNHLVDRDLTLQEIADLPPGWEAQRTIVGASWVRTRIAESQ